jgi:hypothetical protein
VNQFAGERTFGVLTKLDLMDKGTNALDVSASCTARTSGLCSRNLYVPWSHMTIMSFAEGCALRSMFFKPGIVFGFSRNILETVH